MGQKKTEVLDSKLGEDKGEEKEKEASADKKEMSDLQDQNEAPEASIEELKVYEQKKDSKEEKDVTPQESIPLVDSTSKEYKESSHEEIEPEEKKVTTEEQTPVQKDKENLESEDENLFSIKFKEDKQDGNKAVDG